jgi:WD40 repeat protein
MHVIARRFNHDRSRVYLHLLSSSSSHSPYNIIQKMGYADITAPVPFTALKSNGQVLAAGSGEKYAVSSDGTDRYCFSLADGTLRLYDLPSPRVIRAIRGLVDEISSIAFSSAKNQDKETRIWIAAGQNVRPFGFDSMRRKQMS